jgi:Fur family ferric uptake transcriptional regulator
MAVGDRRRQHSARAGEILRRLERGGPAAHVHSSVQRARIVEALFDVGRHFSTEELLAVLAARGRRVGAATVYRALRLLTERGILVERRFGDGVTRYELIDEPERHHDHLICVRCGAIVEFEDDRIEALQRMIAERHGFELRSHTHELYGLCRACAREVVG